MGHVPPRSVITSVTALLLVAILMISVGLAYAASQLPIPGARVAASPGVRADYTPPNTSVFYRTRRWNPPQYPGVGGPMIEIVNDDGSHDVLCSMGFPVYNLSVKHIPWEPVGTGNGIRPEVNIYTTRFWLVTAGHCGKKGYHVYQHETSEAHIGDIQYSILNYPGLQVDAALVLVDQRASFLGPQNTDKIINKILVAKYIVSSCTPSPFNSTITTRDQGNSTFQHLYNDTIPVFKAGWRTGYVMVPNGVVVPNIEKVTYGDGSNITTWIIWLYPLGRDPCDPYAIKFTADQGDSGGPVFAFLGNLSDIASNPDKPIQILGIVAYRDGYGRIGIVPVSKIISEYNRVYRYLRMHVYYGEVGS